MLLKFSNIFLVIFICNYGLLNAFEDVLFEEDDLLKNVKPNYIGDEVLFGKLFGAIKKNDNVDPFIVNGEESRRHSRPYQAGLFIPVGTGTSFCGGSLINLRTILTAAHCIDNISGNITVILGAHNISQIEETQQRFNSNDISLHPGWTPATLENDIAIIRLPEPANITEFVRTILLPTNDEHDYLGNHTLVSGWGQPFENAGAISSLLREVSAPIVSNTACNVAYLGLIQPTNICMSGNLGRSTCFGDSGGPLVLNGVQIGVCSFVSSFGCASGWPSGFARVTSFLEWIAQNSAPDS